MKLIRITYIIGLFLLTLSVNAASDGELFLKKTVIKNAAIIVNLFMSYSSVLYSKNETPYSGYVPTFTSSS